jgi:hypothetical protein
VWREGSSRSNYKHFEKREAVREAERLARINPGQVFYVLKTTAAVIAELPPITHMKMTNPEPDNIPF